MKLIKTLQIGGLVVAVIGMVFHQHWGFFLSGFAVHVAGDILFLRKEGL